MHIWIYIDIWKYLIAGEARGDAEDVQSGDTGYDHEGAGDVCGYEGHGQPVQGRAEDAQVALCRT